MPKIEIYSGDHCPYCVRAKQLLNQQGLAFEEFDVKKDAKRREEMLARSGGARTIPQIFINDRHVGGCDDLYALHQRGELAQWLA
ncbi:MAG: glutaredoxin 3 [Zetaproteobacteria bacterium]|nr:glutaredoxin 3 [Zetaproteobacteria bacterium]